MPITRKDFIVMAEQSKKTKKLVKEIRDWYYAMAFQCVGFSKINPNFKIGIYMKAAGADKEDQAQIMAMYRLMGGI